MNIKQAMQERHAVRNYVDRPIEPKVVEALEIIVAECNKESGLHIQLVRDEPLAFNSKGIHYGKFTGVKNYIALIGKKSAGLEEQCGYYGERIVLEAQMLGLNSCWVGMSYKKVPEAFQIDPGEKLVIVIAIGYGKTGGMQHKSKEAVSISKFYNNGPSWFKAGVDAALLAPSALNQQKIQFELDGDRVRAKAGIGFNTKIDLGIAKYHFEVGADKGRDIWV